MEVAAKRRLILHFDVNRTIVMRDVSAPGKSPEESVVPFSHLTFI